MNAYPCATAGPAAPTQTQNDAAEGNYPAESEHPLSVHAAANILLGLRQVVIHGARNAPSPSVLAPAPLAAPSTMRFAVPLPPNTDPSFRIDITVGGVPGWQMAPEMRRSGHIHSADGAATMSMDSLFTRQDLNAHRGLFWWEMANIKPKLRSWTTKSPATGFTLAHLLRVLVQKQRNNWTESADAGKIDVQKLVGVDVCPRSGVMATVHSLYVVAIRRHTRPASENGYVWYFPQLEVRVCVQ